MTTITLMGKDYKSISICTTRHVDEETIKDIRSQAKSDNSLCDFALVDGLFINIDKGFFESITIQHEDKIEL